MDKSRRNKKEYIFSIYKLYWNKKASRKTAHTEEKKGK